MELLNFTPAKARLARALAQGFEPGSYGEDNNLKISTVRTQINSMSQKAQVSRLPDLIRKVLSLPTVR